MRTDFGPSGWCWLIKICRGEWQWLCLCFYQVASVLDRRHLGSPLADSCAYGFRVLLVLVSRSLIRTLNCHTAWNESPAEWFCVWMEWPVAICTERAMCTSGRETGNNPECDICLLHVSNCVEQNYCEGDSCACVEETLSSSVPQTFCLQETTTAPCSTSIEFSLRPKHCVHFIFICIYLFIYRVIKRSLCTWWLYCNRQVHRDFLITLCFWGGNEQDWALEMWRCLTISLQQQHRPSTAGSPVMERNVLYNTDGDVHFKN